MEIKNVLVKDIKYAPYNPRKISDEVLSKLKRSIEEFGYIEPIVVNKRTMHVVGGNQRLKVLRQLDIKEVQSVIVDLDDTHEKALNIALNKINGEWDLPALKDLLLEIDTGEIDIELTGFEMPEIEELMTQFHIEGEEDNFDVDEAVDEIEEPITKRGDVYLLGRHRLMCGDSTVKKDVEKLMNEKKADMVFTDPPYGVDYEGRTKDKLKIKNDNLQENQLLEMVKCAFNSAEYVSREGAYWYATVPPGPLHLIFASDWKERGILRQILVWVKDSLVMGHSEYHYRHEPILFGWVPGERHKVSDRTRTTVWEFDRPKASRIHPTMKPIPLISNAINDGSIINEIILDLFLGSGSTLIACEQTNRICYGMEIDPVYCDVIVKRWEEYTGKKAELLEN